MNENTLFLYQLSHVWMCEDILYASALCVCLCFEFCNECRLNSSQTSPGEKKQNNERAFSYQVKSHGRLTEHSFCHQAAAPTWRESKHSWLNMHCPHVHREYIFCIASTQNLRCINVLHLLHMQSNSLQKVKERTRLKYSNVCKVLGF